MNPYLPPSKPPLEAEQSESQGKRSPLREALAAAFMMVGVVALVCTLFPWINPIQYSMSTTGNVSLLIRTLVGAAATAALLWTAFHFNRRAKPTSRPK
jgi:uncharacterized membrane-anchored protein